MAESNFIRRNVENGAEFLVSPSSPGIGLTIFAVLFAAVVTIAFFGSALDQLGHINLRGVHDERGFGIFLLICSAVVPCIFYTALKYDRKRRVKVTVLANKDGLRIAENLYSSDDIAEFIILDHGGNNVRSTSGVIVSGGGVAGGAAVAAVGAAMALLSVVDSLGEAHKEGSYRLAIRRRSSSKPEEVIFGLSFDTGAALVNDLIQTLRAF